MKNFEIYIYRFRSRIKVKSYNQDTGPNKYWLDGRRECRLCSFGIQALERNSYRLGNVIHLAGLDEWEILGFSVYVSAAFGDFNAVIFDDGLERGYCSGALKHLISCS